MNTYQVIRTQKDENGIVFVMSNGESVLRREDGREECRNVYGRGFSNVGRFAHIAHAMRLAVRRYKAAA
jgi:hypothetical protein